jgi:hypothetical protein
MGARGSSGVDQLFESKIRNLLKGNQVTGGGNLESGSAMKGPFVAAKEKARQAAT